MRKGALAWSVATLLVLLLAALPVLWIGARQRAAEREQAEYYAVVMLRTLALLQQIYHEKEGAYWNGSISSFLAEMHARTNPPGTMMEPLWRVIDQADARGKARPTMYGYLLESIQKDPRTGYAFRAFPAVADRVGCATFVIDENGESATSP